MKEEVKNIYFYPGLADRDKLSDWNKIKGCKIIIIDDLLQKASASDDIVELFCVLSSHMNYMVFFLIQNVFGDSKRLRTISLNAHYFIIFKNRRDQNQVQALGKQLLPGQPSYFLEAYKKAVSSHPFAYLLIDISPRSNPLYMLRTNILPGETTTVYLPS